MPLIVIHRHYYTSPEVLTKLDLILRRIANMPTKADFDTANTATATALANIESDILALQTIPGGLNEADATAVLADVQANKATAERVAGIVS